MVTTYNNFFTDKMFHDISRYSKETFQSNQHIFKTNYSWNDNVVLDSAPVLIHAVQGDIKTDISKVVREKTNMKDFEVLFYYWSRHSFIPWHNDAHKKSALTIYLNEVWDPNWHGYFMYEDGDEIKAIIPKPNLAIHNLAQTMHCTTPVTHNGFVRATIQIFEEN
jgi:hypothetical protein